MGRSRDTLGSGAGGRAWRRPAGQLGIVLSLALMALAACTDIPVDYRVGLVTPAAHQLPTGLPVVHVSAETTNQGSGPLPGDLPRINDAWSKAVSDALQRSGMFLTGRPTVLDIAITVQGLTGINSTAGISAAAARYVVRLGSGGKVLLDTTILTTGTSPLDGTTASGEDQRDARNNAVRQNIVRFLGALQSIDPAVIPAAS